MHLHMSCLNFFFDKAPWLEMSLVYLQFFWGSVLLYLENLTTFMWTGECCQSQFCLHSADSTSHHLRLRHESGWEERDWQRDSGGLQVTSSWCHQQSIYIWYTSSPEGDEKRKTEARERLAFADIELYFLFCDNSESRDRYHWFTST